MSAEPQPKTVFLNHGPYRRRRLRDAALMLPILGAILMAIPLLWRGSDDPSFTSGTGVYLFVIWGVLIACAAYLSRRVLPEASETPGDDP